MRCASVRSANVASTHDGAGLGGDVAALGGNVAAVAVGVSVSLVEGVSVALAGVGLPAVEVHAVTTTTMSIERAIARPQLARRVRRGVTSRRMRANAEMCRAPIDVPIRASADPRETRRRPGR